jgi:F0F1-type ATP synthase assembly protein I
MRRLERRVAKKAAKATVQHSARGVAAKVKRKPLRSVSLLSVGVLFGAAAGWLGGRVGGGGARG